MFPPPRAVTPHERPHSEHSFRASPILVARTQLAPQVPSSALRSSMGTCTPMFFSRGPSASQPGPAEDFQFRPAPLAGAGTKFAPAFGATTPATSSANGVIQKQHHGRRNTNASFSTRSRTVESSSSGVPASADTTLDQITEAHDDVYPPLDVIAEEVLKGGVESSAASTTAEETSVGAPTKTPAAGGPLLTSDVRFGRFTRAASPAPLASTGTSPMNAATSSSGGSSEGKKGNRNGNQNQFSSGTSTILFNPTTRPTISPATTSSTSSAVVPPARSRFEPLLQYNSTSINSTRINSTSTQHRALDHLQPSPGATSSSANNLNSSLVLYNSSTNSKSLQFQGPHGTTISTGQHHPGDNSGSSVVRPRSSASPPPPSMSAHFSGAHQLKLTSAPASGSLANRSLRSSSASCRGTLEPAARRGGSQGGRMEMMSTSFQNNNSVLFSGAVSPALGAAGAAASFRETAKKTDADELEREIADLRRQLRDAKLKSLLRKRGVEDSKLLAKAFYRGFVKIMCVSNVGLSTRTSAGSPTLNEKLRTERAEFFKQRALEDAEALLAQQKSREDYENRFGIDGDPAVRVETGRRVLMMGGKHLVIVDKT